jgi:RNA polymerase sigma-70 factor (ECF subfamily)
VRVPEDVSHAEWVRCAQQGEADAFCRLVEAYQAPVYNLCYRMLGEPAEAEDAAQETFLRAYRGLGRYDPGRPFGTWLLAVASHYCIDRLRRRRFFPLSTESLLPSQEGAAPEPGPEESLALHERQELLGKVFHALGPQDRAAIVLRYWYDLSYEEIGEVLSLSVGAVKSRLHRARREIAYRWLDQEDVPVIVRGRSNEPSAV